MENVFNSFYQDYDAWYQTQMGAFVHKVETDALWSLLEPQPGMKILDASCGTGNQSLELAAHGCKVTGIDIAPNMLDQATKKLCARGLAAEFQLMDCTKMEFANASFDAAISVAAFEFIPNPQAALREMRRVVKPGGVVVIGTIVRGGEWANLYSSQVCKGTAYEHAKFLSLDDLRQLDPSGFECFVECLFIPPGQPEEAYTESREKSLAVTGKKGGFVCARYK